MPTSLAFTKGVAREDGAAEVVSGQQLPAEIEVGLLTGCQDRPYAFGLAMALASKAVCLDIIGSDEVDSPEFHTTRGLRFLNLRGSQEQSVGVAEKVWRLLLYYAKLIRYATGTKAKILHILWNNKFELFDRTLLMAYYKMLGKKIAFTAHNVNQARRDGKDSMQNRISLRIQYWLSDHIFAHTEKMKAELHQEFGVPEKAITVIRHPVNNAFPDTNLTPAKAKQRLGLQEGEKAVLCFGRVRPYKGIEYLLAAHKLLVARDPRYRLIVAGEPKKGDERYADEIQAAIRREFNPGQVIVKMQFIPDADMELYLKAADVLVLPYKEIFQSGVLFLSYSFGLPVVATDVGSFREEIVEGKTGFLCKPGDTSDMAKTLEIYFASDLYKNLKTRRQEIKDYADIHHSWSAVAELTRNAYVRMLGRHLS